jgi:hypothetical protein
MSTEMIWIGHCYDILYVDAFSLGDPETYPLQPGKDRTGTKEGSAFNLSATNIYKWSQTVNIGSTIMESYDNVISSTKSYQTKLKTSVSGSANYLAYSGSMSTEVDYLVKNDLSQKKVTTLTTSTRKTKKVSLLKEDSSVHPPLDTDFQSALWSASSSQSSFDTFTLKYGTHFSTTVTLGGSGRQSFDLKTKSVAELSELGVDISAQASAVIKAIELNGSVGSKSKINQSFLNEILAQSTTITFLGGGDDTDFKEWMKTVDDNPVPIEVSLIDHSFFFSENYFPNKTGIAQAEQKFKNYLSSYIQSNGRNLGASEIADGDLICICEVAEETGGDLPPMLMQGDSPVSIQTVVKALDTTVSPQEFMASYASEYPEYVWKVEHSKSSEKGQSFMVNELITLTNLKTGFKLNGEGANPHLGWVSAENDKNIMGTKPKTSCDWRIKNKIDYFNGSVEQPINSGDIIAFHRVYNDPVPADPTGYLSIRNKQAFSTGQVMGNATMIEQKMAFQIFKLNE